MPYFDGAVGRSYYRHWATAGRPRAALVFLHGINENTGLYHRFAAELGGHGIDVWALDQIGHGLSEGERGHAGPLEALVADAGALTRIALEESPDVPLAIGGHSLGSLVAVLAALDNPDTYVATVVSGAPLSAPDWLTKAVAAGGGALDFPPEALSSDPFYVDQLATDPFGFDLPDGVEVLDAVFGPAWRRLETESAHFPTPLLVVQGERDTIAPVAGVQPWRDRIPDLRLEVIEGAGHDVLNEVAHTQVADLVAGFLVGQVGGPGRPGLSVSPQERAAIDGLLRFPLLGAINGRRSRRFPVGGTIPSGELAFTSSRPVQPLSEVERALVLATVTGVTGWNFGITHHPGYAPALPNYSGSAVGRTFPSAAGFHTTDFFFTDDSGTYFLSSRDAAPTGEWDGEVPDIDTWLAATVSRYRRLSEHRLWLPREEPYLEGHNTWIANHPGSLLVIPVADLAQHLIANLAFFIQNGYGVYDDVHDRPIPGADDPSLRHAGEPFPLSFVEQYTLAEASAELITGVYNGHLLLGAMGLGGWTFDGIDRLSMLGASGNPEVPGLGFHVETDERWTLPNPTGLPGVFETLARPHVGDAGEAVERYAERKFGPGGPFHPRTGGPWRDTAGVRGSAAPYDARFLRLLTEEVRYVDETFGKIPGTVQTVHILNYLQAQHLDPDFYDHHFGPGAYLPTHRDHQDTWH